jgi:hypothetical protein
MNTDLIGKKVAMKANVKKTGVIHGAGISGNGVLILVVWDAVAPSQNQEITSVFAVELWIVG